MAVLALYCQFGLSTVFLIKLSEYTDKIEIPLNRLLRLFILFFHFGKHCTLPLFCRGSKVSFFKCDKKIKKVFKFYFGRGLLGLFGKPGKHNLKWLLFWPFIFFKRSVMPICISLVNCTCEKCTINCTFFTCLGTSLHFFLNFTSFFFAEYSHWRHCIQIFIKNVPIIRTLNPFFEKTFLHYLIIKLSEANGVLTKNA